MTTLHITQQKVDEITIPAIRGMRVEHVSDVPEPRKILLAALPKSGSTYLARLLSNFFDLPIRPYNYNGGLCNGGIYPPSAVLLADTSGLAYVCTTADEDTEHLISAFGLTPILLVRNLLDVVVSYRDHVERYRSGVNYMNFGAIQVDDFLRRSHREQHDIIIDLCVPWMMNFYASWYRYTQTTKPAPLWLSYDGVMPDQPNALRETSHFLGVEFDAGRAMSTILTVELEQNLTRFNRGVAGRGKATLNEDQVERVTRMAAYFNDVDFARYGFLESPERTWQSCAKVR